MLPLTWAAHTLFHWTTDALSHLNSTCSLSPEQQILSHLNNRCSLTCTAHALSLTCAAHALTWTAHALSHLNNRCSLTWTAHALSHLNSTCSHLNSTCSLSPEQHILSPEQHMLSLTPEQHMLSPEQHILSLTWTTDALSPEQQMLSHLNSTCSLSPEQHILSLTWTAHALSHLNSTCSHLNSTCSLSPEQHILSLTWTTDALSPEQQMLSHLNSTCSLSPEQHKLSLSPDGSVEGFNLLLQNGRFVLHLSSLQLHLATVFSSCDKTTRTPMKLRQSFIQWCIKTAADCTPTRGRLCQMPVCHNCSKLMTKLWNHQLHKARKKTSVMGHKLTGRNTECKEIRKHGPPPMEGYTPSSKPRPSPHRLLIWLHHVAHCVGWWNARRCESDSALKWLRFASFDFNDYDLPHLV